jgi:hypothetical protein
MVAFHLAGHRRRAAGEIVCRTRTVPADFDVIRTARAMGISMGD